MNYQPLQVFAEDLEKLLKIEQSGTPKPGLKRGQLMARPRRQLFLRVYLTLTTLALAVIAAAALLTIRRENARRNEQARQQAIASVEAAITRS